MPTFSLISYALCPYVQRVSIALREKGAEFDRVNVDLSAKPTWFAEISPLGKVPLLKVQAENQRVAIFESTVILEYLEETLPNPLHPTDPLDRAAERSWMEFGTSILNDIGGLYSAKTDAALAAKRLAITTKLERIDQVLKAGPWFSGDRFGLVDAVFAPVFRYFDVFDQIEDFGVFTGRKKLMAWRENLSERPSVRSAVPSDYPDLLKAFLYKKQSALSARMDQRPNL